MFKSIRIRAAVTIILCLAALVFLAPTLTSDLPEFWKKYLPTDKIHLGLDLQGGMHLVLEVETSKAVEIFIRTSAAFGSTIPAGSRMCSSRWHSLSAL